MPLWAAAQSPAVKKAGQSVLVLTSFNKDGTIHTVSHAVLTGNTGEAIAMWHDLKALTMPSSLTAKVSSIMLMPC